MTEQAWYARLGRALKEERLRRGWTLYDAAAVAGVSHAAISRWERGLDRMKAWHYVALKEEGLLP